MNINTIFIIIAIILLLLIFLMIPSLQKMVKVNINPSRTSNKVNCVNQKKSCKNDNDCQSSCNEEQLKCISTTQYGKVCLPSEPDNSCNTQKGGIKLWTGYGFTEKQDWSCFCEYPEYYTGANCEVTNPYYCTDGMIDPTKPLQDESCICPSGTEKMYRATTNVPFCAKTLPEDGGGMYGLKGNITKSPNWTNIIIKRDTDIWVNDIYNELYKNSLNKNQIKNNIKNILDNNNNNINKLSYDIVKQFCNIDPKPDYLCNPLCNEEDFNKFNINESIYTYYKNAYFM